MQSANQAERLLYLGKGGGAFVITFVCWNMLSSRRQLAAFLQPHLGTRQEPNLSVQSSERGCKRVV